ncbi:rhamnogalacturonan acetylesterase [Evansella sp. AB-rgal1]|uniref:rhamnogalacturonan acetylesterase n=1 Tax=Evansella sp. AB-rgal1 TaxID=3242696 RepID=UPI00359E1B69
MTTVRLFLVGDSTVSSYDSSRAPRAGWGQVLHNYLNDQIEIRNEAASGRSSKSFLDEKRFVPVEEIIESSDILIIQFGHNDEKEDPERHTEPFTTFQQYLTTYIELALEKGASPILVTPVQRRSFDEQGVFFETHGDYPLAIKELGKRLDVPVIDLGEKSKQLLESLGPEASKKLFLWFEPGEEENYPNGEKDDTHFSEYGANKIAQLVIDECKNHSLPLVDYID